MRITFYTNQELVLVVAWTSRSRIQYYFNYASFRLVNKSVSLQRSAVAAYCVVLAVDSRCRLVYDVSVHCSAVVPVITCADTSRCDVIRDDVTITRRLLTLRLLPLQAEVQHGDLDLLPGLSFDDPRIRFRSTAWLSVAVVALLNFRQPWNVCQRANRRR